MLLSASVRDIVLIDRLDVEFGRGLCAITGETGAGKTILIDALGFVTGERSDRGLLRAGAAQGAVTAVFEPERAHPSRGLLGENGIWTQGEIILRRTISADGRTRAFVNDQPVSIGLLRALGETLFELHGQHAERGLLAPAQHRGLLDEFGENGEELADAARAHAAWRETAEALAHAERLAAAARADADYLAHSHKELSGLAPQPGEEEALAAERTLLMNAEKIAGEVAAASEALSGGDGLEVRLAQGLRKLERLAPQAAGRLDAAVAALARAVAEFSEARHALDVALRDVAFDGERLEKAEERLFALKAAARKYGVPVAELPRVAEEAKAKLDALEGGEEKIAALKKAAGQAEAAFVRACEDLSTLRERSARQLELAVARELKPLKLEKARFRVRREKMPREAWGATGADRIEFEVSTNPGAPFGPLQRIASGGEMARFALALKVSLTHAHSACTLVFDEVDQGVGGAVADAVGERLKRLAGGAQVIVVTHSPQIAARADRHYRIVKAAKGGAALARIAELDEDGRREEIARMISGARITDEARAAAERLIAGGGRR